MWLCRFAQTGAAVSVAGAATLRILAWGITSTSRAAPRWNRLAVASLAVLLTAAVCQLGLTAAQMGDLPLAQIFERHTLVSVLEKTHFGSVWQVRLVLLIGLFVIEIVSASLLRRRETPHRMFDVAAMLFAFVILASLVASGHAQASNERTWLLPTDMVHASAAGAWPGGLIPLVVMLARARHCPDLLPSAITITRRFSRLSVAAVGVLAVSGSLNSYALLGSFNDLWSSVYGRLIVFKGVLFAAMVALGWVNKRLIEQRTPENPQVTVSRLWHNVALECMVASAVLLGTEILAMSNPPTF